MGASQPVDPVQRRLAERRLVAALGRFHRREPLRADIRVDRLIEEVRDHQPTGGGRHRGRGPLTLTDGELRAIVDELVAAGTLRRDGHRVRLPADGSELGPVMRARVEQLLAELEKAGTTPPPPESIAARLGIPIALLDQLRASGELVAVGPRIEFPRATWLTMAAELDRLAADRPLTVRAVREGLHTTRRRAEAILRRRSDQR